MLTSPRVRDAVRACAANQADPFCAYLYDLAALREHARQARSALPAGCRLLYAVKANDDPRILATLADVIDGFEIASGGELDRVRAVSAYAPLVFGGPAKTDSELAAAVADGHTQVNVESQHELQQLEFVAAGWGRRQPACLRVNLAGPLPGGTIAMAGEPTQFGIDEHEIPAVLDTARRCPHVDITGFHFHSISNHLDAEDHLALVRRYLGDATTWAAKADLDLRILNCGGGVGVDIAGAAHHFDWARFTAGLAEARAQAPNTELVFECGRYLTAECGTYAVQVLDIKHNHGTWFAIVRGGTHHLRLPTSWGYSHPFEVLPVDRWNRPVARPAVRDVRVTVVGELCTPKDVLATDIAVPRLRAGDILLFPFAGAYGWSISHHNFLRHPHPQHIHLP